MIPYKFSWEVDYPGRDYLTYKVENPYLEEIIRLVYRKLMEQEEEAFTQEVIKALERKGYTVSKNE